VIDIMEALKRTLEIKKKPVQAASECGGEEEAVATEEEAPRRSGRAGSGPGSFNVYYHQTTTPCLQLAETEE